MPRRECAHASRPAGAENQQQDADEDISVTDLVLPATTDPAKLHAKLTDRGAGRITVVFSTYQSIGVVHRAQAMGLPERMFPVMFAIPRTAGWVAQWREMITDSEQKIARPRQVYVGERRRDYVPIDKRA